MSYELDSFEHNGLIVNIVNDEDSENPREWSTFSKMVCWNKRYDLGDKHTFQDPEDFTTFLKETPCIMLPLFLYDHSGISMNTTGFSCPWDRGQVWYIYITLEDVRKEYGVKRVSKKLRKRIEEYLRVEVNVYDSYLRGAVYGHVITDKDGEEIEACYGFYDLEHVKEDAISIIDYITKKQNAA